MVKWISAFGLSNNKMAMVDVDDSNLLRTHSPCQLAWSEGWRPPVAESAFIIWTGWTPALALCHDDSTINIILVIIILLLPNIRTVKWKITVINATKVCFLVCFKLYSFLGCHAVLFHVQVHHLKVPWDKLDYNCKYTVPVIMVLLLCFCLLLVWPVIVNLTSVLLRARFSKLKLTLPSTNCAST